MPRYHLLSLQAAWAAPAYRESVNHFLQDSQQLAAVLRAGQPWCLVFSWGPVGSPVHPSLIRPHCRRDHTELGGGCQDPPVLPGPMVGAWVGAQEGQPCRAGGGTPPPSPRSLLLEKQQDVYMTVSGW